MAVVNQFCLDIKLFVAPPRCWFYAFQLQIWASLISELPQLNQIKFGWATIEKIDDDAYSTCRRALLSATIVWLQAVMKIKTAINRLAQTLDRIAVWPSISSNACDWRCSCNCCQPESSCLPWPLVRQLVLLLLVPAPTLAHLLVEMEYICSPTGRQWCAGEHRLSDFIRISSRRRSRSSPVISPWPRCWSRRGRKGMGDLVG